MKKRYLSTLFLLNFLIFSNSILYGQTASLVKDINTAPDGIYTWNASYGMINNDFFVTIGTDSLGYELWKSDGTSAGTQLFLDIAPGVNSGYPHDYVLMNGNLYFTVYSHPVYGTEVWKTDGTVAGTGLLKDITPGNAGGLNSHYKTVLGNTMYFAEAYQTELWKTDGDSTTTVLVKNIHQGGTYARITEMVAHNGMIYFAADNGLSGVELWKSDGTDAGTVMLKDIWAGSGNGDVRKFLSK